MHLGQPVTASPPPFGAGHGRSWSGPVAGRTGVRPDPSGVDPRRRHPTRSARGCTPPRSPRCDQRANLPSDPGACLSIRGNGRWRDWAFADAKNRRVGPLTLTENDRICKARATVTRDVSSTIPEWCRREHPRPRTAFTPRTTGPLRLDTQAKSYTFPPPRAGPAPDAIAPANAASSRSQIV